MVDASLKEEAKLEFSMELSEYIGVMHEVYHMTTSLNKLFEIIKKIDLFKCVDFRRLDTVMHNKLVSTLKEFDTYNIDPIFFIDENSNSYYVGNFYSRYILRYFAYLANNIVNCINNLLEHLGILDTDIDKYIKHHNIKFTLSSLKNENIVLSEPKLYEDYQKCLDIYNEYRRLNDEFYEFDIKRDYLKIANFTLDKMLNANVSDIKVMVRVQYGMDLDYLKSVQQEDLISELQSLYRSKLEEKGIDSSFIEEKTDKFFTKPVTDNNVALELTKLTYEDLNGIISESVFRNINSQIKGNDNYRSSDKEIVELMINFNRSMHEQFKKLEKGLK